MPNDNATVKTACPWGACKFHGEESAGNCEHQKTQSLPCFIRSTTADDLMKEVLDGFDIR